MNFRVIVTVGTTFAFFVVLALAKESVPIPQSSSFAEASSRIEPRNDAPNTNVRRIELTNSERPSVRAQTHDQIPDEVLFDMFFIKVVAVQRAAISAQAKHENAGLWRNYLRRQSFDEQQVKIITRIANDHASAIAPIQARAVNIIKAGRKALGVQGSLPPAPAELTTLQKQRLEVTLRSRDKLQHELGTEAMQQIRHLMLSHSNSVELSPNEMMSQDERLNLFKEKMEVRRND